MRYLQEKVKALQSHGDVIYVCSATDRLPSKLDGIDVVSALTVSSCSSVG